MSKKVDEKVRDCIEDLGCMFNGAHLYRKPTTAGGHIYYTDEYGVMSEICNTSIANESTLLAVLLAERQRKYLEQIVKRKQSISGYVDEKQIEDIRRAFLNPLPTNKVE